MEKINCPICGSNNNTFYLSLKDRLGSDKGETFNLVKCDCNFVFLNPRPSELEISKYYSHKNYSPHKKNSFLYRLAQKISFFWKYNLIKRYGSKTRILDYGSGMGDFSSYMNKKGFSVDSYEPILNSKNEIKSNYNIITMWHSLEHIHDLEASFETINNNLKDNGYLIIAVPNLDAAEISYFNENWAPYDAPRHLYHFNFNSINNLLDKYGFKIIKHKMVLQDTFYNVYLSLKKRSYIYFIYAFFLSIFKILLNSNKASSKLYICIKK